MIDQFLREHDVDVGRFIAAISFFGAATRVFDVVGALLAGRVSLDFGIPIGVIIGVGLWRHRSWARTLVIVITWLAAIFFALLVVVALTGMRLNVTLTFGNTSFAHPTPVQAIVFACTALAFTGLVLAALNSDKVKEEFIPGRRPNQPPEPTVLSVTICAYAQLAPASTVAHL